MKNNSNKIIASAEAAFRAKTAATKALISARICSLRLNAVATMDGSNLK